MWRIAYLDGARTFRQRVRLGPADVALMLPPEGALRLVPKDPRAPLSPANWKLVSPLRRRRACVVWRRLEDPAAYARALTS